MPHSIHGPSWTNRIRRAVYQLTRHSAHATLLREALLLQLQLLPRNTDARRLVAHEHKAFSQNGEDGAIGEIFRRIGIQSRFFVEIGVGDGLENNTTLLLLQGWSGTWIEGSSKNCQNIRQRFRRQLASGQLQLIEAVATQENVSDLIRPTLGHKNLDLLSVDVDRNTYHVWKGLSGLSARVAVIEYNALFPPQMHWIASDTPSRWWNGSSYFGASLAALSALGNSQGFNLVGCDLTGTNAFFVAEQECGDCFLLPYTPENHYEPLRYYLQRPVHGHYRAISDEE